MHQISDQERWSIAAWFGRLGLIQQWESFDGMHDVKNNFNDFSKADVKNEETAKRTKTKDISNN